MKRWFVPGLGTNVDLTAVKEEVKSSLDKWKSGDGKDPPERTFDPLKYEREAVFDFDPKKLHDEIKGECEKRRTYYSPVFRLWELLLGHTWMQDWLKWDSVHNRLRNLAKISGVPAYSTPHLFDAVRRGTMLQVANPPRIGFMPPGPQPEAQDACRSANIMLPHLDRANRTRRQEVRHAFETTTIGTTIHEVFVDSSEQKIFTKENGNRKVQLASHRLADPWNIFPNVGAKGFRRNEGCRNVIQRDVLHIEEVYNTYRVWLKPEVIQGEKRPGPFDDTDPNSYSQPRDVEDSVEVYTVRIAGCEEASNGREIITAGGLILKYDDGLLKSGEIPLIMRRYMATSDDFHGVPYPRQAIPALREINSIMTKVLTAVYRKLAEWWGIESGSNVNMKQFLSRFRYRYFKYTGKLPENLAKAIQLEINQYTPVLDRLYRDVDNALAFHDISRSGDQTLDTATQADIASENDLKAWSITYDERECGYMELAEFRMQVQQEHGSDELLYATHGKAMPWEMQTFKKTDFNAHLWAMAFSDSGRPMTAASKLKRLQDMFNLGVINPDMLKDINVAEAAVSFFEGVETDAFFARIKRQRSRAQNENLLLIKGEAVPVEVRQLHRIHIDTHEAVLDDPSVRSTLKPDAAIIFYKHVAAHYLMENNVRHAERQAQIPIEMLQPGQQLAYPHGVASLLDDEMVRIVRGSVRKRYMGLRGLFGSDEEYEAAIEQTTQNILGRQKIESEPDADIAEEERELQEERLKIVGGKSI